MLDYTQIDFPLTFEDIFILWVGKEKYGEIKSDGPYICDDYLYLIRSVENQLDSAIRNNHIRLYSQRIAAGRTFYYEIPYNQGELFAGTRPGYGDELYKCFQFMRHHPNIISAKSEPLYFDRNEIFTYFPFLNSVGQESPSASEARTEADQPVTAVSAASQGGSNPETDKIVATTAACRVVNSALSDGYHLDEHGQISREQFLNTVKEVMTNQGTVLLFQISTAKKIFAKDLSIKRFKTSRGRPKTQG